MVPLRGASGREYDVDAVDTAEASVGSCTRFARGESPKGIGEETTISGFPSLINVDVEGRVLIGAEGILSPSRSKGVRSSGGCC